MAGVENVKTKEFTNKKYILVTLAVHIVLVTWGEVGEEL